jgi:hypothetical protein
MPLSKAVCTAESPVANLPSEPRPISADRFTPLSKFCLGKWKEAQHAVYDSNNAIAKDLGREERKPDKLIIIPFVFVGLAASKILHFILSILMRLFDYAFTLAMPHRRVQRGSCRYRSRTSDGGGSQCNGSTRDRFG